MWILHPQIIRRLNYIRNKLEHDYEAPNYTEAENYVDIIELFLVATSVFIKTIRPFMSFYS